MESNIILDKINEKYKCELKNFMDDLSFENIDFLYHMLNIRDKIKVLTNKIIKKIKELKLIEYNIVKINKFLKISFKYDDLFYKIIKKSEKLKFIKNNNLDLINALISLKTEKINTMTEKLNEVFIILQKKNILNNIIKIIEDKSDNINILCTICDNDNIKYCMNPCGHLFCDNCSLRIINNKCHICRSNIINQIKMYGI